MAERLSVQPRLVRARASKEWVFAACISWFTHRILAGSLSGLDNNAASHQGVTVYAALSSITSPSKAQMELQALVSSVVDLLDTANRQLDVNREAARASISRASSLLWVEINKDFERDPRHSPRALLGWQVRRVRDYVDAHLSKRILVSDLSAIVQRSEAHFARAFKKTFGVSPHAYVLRRRVEKASYLMLVSDDSLSDIALACGMTDQAHLCKIFRQTTGQTPAAWRRERRALTTDREIWSMSRRGSWTRRAFLRGTSAGIALLPPTLRAGPGEEREAESAGYSPHFFTSAEWNFINAAVVRLIPDC
jgi:AraC family transcriptional regulator